MIDDPQPSEQRKGPRVTRTKALVGGFCGLAVSTITHPLDLVKVRMQIFPGAINTMAMAKRIVECEGLSALYVGWTAGLMRQATFTTTRLGVYSYLYENFKNKHHKIPTLYEEIMFGSFAGAVGAFAGNPSEVILVRRVADGRRDPCTFCSGPNPRYNSTIDAIYKITSSEGVRALWRGGTLTVARSALIGFSQISSDTKAREFLVKRQWEGSTLLLCVAFISSFATATLTLPVDMVKSRYQYNREDMMISQTEVVKDILRNEGFLHFWHGFFPYFTRLFIHTSFTYIILTKILNAFSVNMVINTIVHPLDLLKVRMQIFPGSITSMAMAKRIIRCEGLGALYVGWTAGVLRQATYTTTRLGTYAWMYEEYKNEYYKVPSLPVKMMIGTVAGIAGALAGTPSEVILVRRLGDGRRDPCYICSSPCPRYRGTLHAIYKITLTEGVRVLWRGGLLTIGRSVLVSFTHIGIDAKAREALEKRHWEGNSLKFFIAFTSTFVTACLTLPVDTMKSRYG